MESASRPEMLPPRTHGRRLAPHQKPLPSGSSTIAMAIEVRVDRFADRVRVWLMGSIMFERLSVTARARSR